MTASDHPRLSDHKIVAYPLPRPSQVGVGLNDLHPKPSQIGVDFRDMASIGVGLLVFRSPDHQIIRSPDLHAPIHATRILKYLQHSSQGGLSDYPTPYPPTRILKYLCHSIPSHPNLA